MACGILVPQPGIEPRASGGSAARGQPHFLMGSTLSVFDKRQAEPLEEQRGQTRDQQLPRGNLNPLAAT